MLSNLKKLRHEFGISQQRLADAIQVSQSAINKYENHNVEPDLDILMRLADFFNTSVDYIIGYTDVRRKIEDITAYHLNNSEVHMLSRYRALSSNEQDCVNHVINTLMDKHSSSH